MKRVLIVTPNWPPVSCPDLHRVRTALPHFREFGWEPLILKVDPEEQEGIKDPDLCRTLPDGVRTWQSGCLPLQMTAWCGIRSVGLRSHFHLGATGNEIIRQMSPNVVFFSTTMFPVMTLGRYWRRKHGVPYVLDFQDPWVSDAPGPAGEAQTRKRSVMARSATYLEPFALRRASHVVSVSPRYPQALCGRYPWLRPDQFTVLPFGAADGDFQLLRRLSVKQKVFDPRDGKQHWVYAGRGGTDMGFALRSLFTALKQTVDSRPTLRDTLRLHFVGTDYAPGDRARKTIEPLAREMGLGDMVSEQTQRLPYFEALQCLLDADALVVPGSDDAGYTASKLFPYILARRPLLAVFNAESSVVDILNRTRAGTVVPFTANDSTEAVARRVCATGWLQSPPAPNVNWPAFESYTSKEMTKRLCRVFDECTKN